MSQENIDLYRQAIDAMNRRDLDAFLAVMDDDVESGARIIAVEGALHGHAGVRQWWENWFAAFPDYRIEVTKIWDSGEVTIATLRALGHGAGSAVPLEDEIWQANRWRHGKVIWWHTFNTREEALKAVGLEG